MEVRKLVETPEIEIAPEDITEGAKHTRKVKVKSSNPFYDSKTFIIRSLKAGEFSRAMKKVGLSRDQDPAESFDFMLEACRLGIVNKAVADQVNLIDEDVILQVGSAILAVTNPSERSVENFSNPPRGS
jgi:hypothetical protein